MKYINEYNKNVNPKMPIVLMTYFSNHLVRASVIQENFPPTTIIQCGLNIIIEQSAMNGNKPNILRII